MDEWKIDLITDWKINVIHSLFYHKHGSLEILHSNSSMLNELMTLLMAHYY